MYFIYLAKGQIIRQILVLQCLALVGYYCMMTLNLIVVT